MTHGHRLESRADVVFHLTASAHGWENAWFNFPMNVRDSDVKDMNGRPFVPTSEYLAIHRELHAVADMRQW